MSLFSFSVIKTILGVTLGFRLGLSESSEDGRCLDVEGISRVVMD